MKWTSRIIIAIIIIAFLGSGYILWAMFAERIEVAENIDRAEWLPASASSILYYVNKNISGVVACEFSISESDFLDFAMQHEWPVRKIETSISITRYTWFIEESKTSNHSAIIEQGYYYSNRKPNGAHINLAYDLERQIAYVERSSR